MEKTTAKVFMNGRSQAVRLPRDFRVEGSEVYITKKNNQIIISEKSEKTWAEIIDELPAFGEFDVNRKAISRNPREVAL